MKNVTLFAAALASVSFAANAQTINSSWVPAVGFSQTYNVVNLNGPLSPGAAGSGQTWNFASAASDSTFVLNNVATAAAAGGSNFPSASFATQYSDGGTPSATFYESSSSMLQVVGLYAGDAMGNISAEYTEPVDAMRFPINFGDAYVDSFYADFTSSLGLNFSFTGNTSVEVDGSGSLTTPAGTYNNVLRMKSTQDYEYIGLPPTPGSSNTGVTTTYMWISPDYPGYYLMTYSIDVAGTSNDTSVSYVDPNFVGIADAATQSLQISPNPANDQVAVNFPTGADLSRVELLDLSGRIIATENINGKSNRAILSTSTYTSGMYILRAVDTKGATVTSKVMVAH